VAIVSYIDFNSFFFGAITSVAYTICVPITSWNICGVSKWWRTLQV